MRALYTITSQTAQVRYAGNGATTAFSVTFQFFESSTLRVRTAIGDAVTLKVLNTDYTVSGGAGSTGTVTFVTAPPTGTNVIIDLNMPVTQETVDLAPNGPLPAEDVEQGFDRVVTIVKQLRQQLLAVPELDATFNPDTDDPPILPPPSNGKFIVGREDELGWENADAFSTETLPTLLTSLADQDLFEYDSGGAVWRNKALATVLGRMLTTRGDIFLRGASSVSRLALGAANRFLKSDGTDLAYGQVDLASGDVTGVVPRANGGFTPSQITAALGANVAMGATGTYYTGPSIAQGTSGTWFVSGNVTVENTVGGDVVNVKLWDGTTVIASTRVQVVSVSGSYYGVAALSGYIASPAGNLRISVSPVARTDGAIVFNASGNSKDSVISAFRIA